MLVALGGRGRTALGTVHCEVTVFFLRGGGGMIYDASQPRMNAPTHCNSFYHLLKVILRAIHFINDSRIIPFKVTSCSTVRGSPLMGSVWLVLKCFSISRFSNTAPETGETTGSCGTSPETEGKEAWWCKEVRMGLGKAWKKNCHVVGKTEIVCMCVCVCVCDAMSVQICTSHCLHEVQRVFIIQIYNKDTF